MTDYAERLCAHLCHYKRLNLGVGEAGTFHYRGEDLPYHHILPIELKWLNILEPFRDEIREYVRARPGLRLHKYFHHLNSSQAFVLNLFFPFCESGGSDMLLRAMGITGTISSWSPESIADQAEGTNIDVVWCDSSNRWTYCEVKLSEQGFGTAKADQRHQRKLEHIYAPALRPYVSPELLTPAKFFSRYQILRNIWLAARDPTASVVFLLPRENAALWEPLHEVVSGLLPPLRSRIYLVEIEEVLSRLAADARCPAHFSGYAAMLAEKYLPAGR